MTPNTKLDKNHPSVKMLIEETAKPIKYFLIRLISIAIFAFLIIVGLVIFYICVSKKEVFISANVGALLLSFTGTLFLGFSAFQNPISIARMSCSALGFNPDIYVELSKARYSAIVGTFFIVIGCLIQGSLLLIYP